LILTSSFATQRFSLNYNLKDETSTRNPNFSKWSHFFLKGIGQRDFSNSAEIFKDKGGVSFVETKEQFVQVLINLLLGNILLKNNEYLLQ